MQFGEKKKKTCSPVKKEWEWDWGEGSNFAVIQLLLIIVLPPPQCREQRWKRGVAWFEAWVNQR